MKTFITAEIGINHNGDLEIAKKLIDTAVIAGCDAVKFQKRTVDKAYSQEELDKPCESPWGSTKRELAQRLEFDADAYDEIDAYCKKKGIPWYASAWDMEAKLFLNKYNLEYNKIASAMLTNDELMETVADEGRYTFISTGMSTFEEIDHAVDIFRKHDCPFELMHCVSAYPMLGIDANLKVMQALKKRYDCKVGYSGHEIGTLVSTCAVAMGASSLERHVTLDKNMYGSNQKSAIEPMELWKLVRDIRETELIIGTGEKKFTKEELIMREKYRK